MKKILNKKHHNTVGNFMLMLFVALVSMSLGMIIAGK